MNPTKSVENWNVEDVRDWLQRIGCGEYRALFSKHKINGPALISLTEKELFKYMEITVVGDVKQIVLAIKKLQIKVYNSANYDVLLRSSTDSCTPKTNHNGHLSRKDIPLKGATKCQNLVRTSSLDSNISDILGNESAFIQGIPSDPALPLEPEIWKTLLSIAYFIAVTLITSVTMVVVHDRVPDMKKYPPLPDIFLDNVPLIPWAFDMCELTGCVLMLLWGAVLVFHKHRFILMRRFFALSGSVFLIRCITMLITSLSVPGSHLECSPRPYGNVWARLRQAYLIWSGFGMSVVGVRTCGDYMFSGHTVVLTMLNFFITEYTSRRIYFLHTLTWLLNMFGIFFILAAHEHYSIDVFVAFYITSRLFLYYHTLANNRTLMQRDSRRTKVWFPLFSFFESRVEGIIPNEFEWPITWSKVVNVINYVGGHFSKLEKSHKKEQVNKESKRKKCN